MRGGAAGQRGGARRGGGNARRRRGGRRQRFRRRAGVEGGAGGAIQIDQTGGECNIYFGGRTEQGVGEVAAGGAAYSMRQPSFAADTVTPELISLLREAIISRAPVCGRR